MKKELDPRWAIGAIVVVVLVVAVLAWRQFSPRGSGRVSAAEAGLGKPMLPGEIPGKASGVNAPIIPASPGR